MLGNYPHAFEGGVLMFTANYLKWKSFMKNKKHPSTKKDVVHIQVKCKHDDISLRRRVLALYGIEVGRIHLIFHFSYIR